MRTLLVLILASTPWASAAEKPGRAVPTVRLAQVAPDGFPLAFPEPSLAIPPVATTTEELPVPTSPGPVLPSPPVTVLPTPRSVPVHYLTHREFAASFRPVPGNYEVMMVHPYTRRPVKVCFSLPPGPIRCVDADRNELRFDYGSWELEVHFKRDGRVALDIDD